jgi:hypothetical protein
LAVTPEPSKAEHEKLIYDWNTADGAPRLPARRVTLDDESLRDGLQSPSVSDPPIQEKIRILHLMEAPASIPPTSDFRPPGLAPPRTLWRWRGRRYWRRWRSIPMPRRERW